MFRLFLLISILIVPVSHPMRVSAPVPTGVFSRNLSSNCTFNAFTMELESPNRYRIEYSVTCHPLGNTNAKLDLHFATIIEKLQSAVAFHQSIKLDGNADLSSYFATSAARLRGLLDQLPSRVKLRVHRAHLDALKEVVNELGQRPSWAVLLGGLEAFATWGASVFRLVSLPEMQSLDDDFLPLQFDALVEFIREVKKGAAGHQDFKVDLYPSSAARGVPGLARLPSWGRPEITVTATGFSQFKIAQSYMTSIDPGQRWTELTDTLQRLENFVVRFDAKPDDFGLLQEGFAWLDTFLLHEHGALGLSAPAGFCVKVFGVTPAQAMNSSMPNPTVTSTP